jgi:hypothetical protein
LPYWTVRGRREEEGGKGRRRRKEEGGGRRWKEEGEEGSLPHLFFSECVLVGIYIEGLKALFFLGGGRREEGGRK